MASETLQDILLRRRQRSDRRGYRRVPRFSTSIRSLLRFITCGSVDDGKSTLIGRLLYDSKMIFEDQLAALEADSKRVDTQGQNIDFALLVDGLAAEREQGITIDVAYRFFSTDKRKFIVADTPGHEQYTRNMVTGASTADLAVILIDARKGRAGANPPPLLPRARSSALKTWCSPSTRWILLATIRKNTTRSSRIIERRSQRVHRHYEHFTADADFRFHGRQHHQRHPKTRPWYTGHTLMEHLEIGGAGRHERLQRKNRFSLPVQWVNRPNLDFRGFSGHDRLAASSRPAMPSACSPPARVSTVTRIVTLDSDLGARHRRPVRHIDALTR